jgi:hypothetical protein
MRSLNEVVLTEVEVIPRILATEAKRNAPMILEDGSSSVAPLNFQVVGTYIQRRPYRSLMIAMIGPVMMEGMPCCKRRNVNFEIYRLMAMTLTACTIQTRLSMPPTAPAIAKAFAAGAILSYPKVNIVKGKPLTGAIAYPRNWEEDSIRNVTGDA